MSAVQLPRTIWFVWMAIGQAYRVHVYLQVVIPGDGAATRSREYSFKNSSLTQRGEHASALEQRREVYFKLEAVLIGDKQSVTVSGVYSGDAFHLNLSRAV